MHYDAANHSYKDLISWKVLLINNCYDLALTIKDKKPKIKALYVLEKLKNSTQKIIKNFLQTENFNKCIFRCYQENVFVN